MADFRLQTFSLFPSYPKMKRTTHNFKKLDVWERGRRLVKTIYDVTSEYPSSEKFGLTSQTRRCAVSIPSNIAEGSGRNSNKQMTHFCSIGRGSAFELETQIILGQDLGFLPVTKSRELLLEISQIQRMLDGLIAAIEQKSH